MFSLARVVRMSLLYALLAILAGHERFEPSSQAAGKYKWRASKDS